MVTEALWPSGERLCFRCYWQRTKKVCSKIGWPNSQLHEQCWEGTTNIKFITEISNVSLSWWKELFPRVWCLTRCVKFMWAMPEWLPGENWKGKVLSLLLVGIYGGKAERPPTPRCHYVREKRTQNIVHYPKSNPPVPNSSWISKLTHTVTSSLTGPMSRNLPEAESQRSDNHILLKSHTATPILTTHLLKDCVDLRPVLQGREAPFSVSVSFHQSVSIHYTKLSQSCQTTLCL